MFLKVIYSRSHYPITSSTTFNYVILSDYTLISALVLVTQEIPIIVDCYLLVNYSTFTPRSPRPIVTQLDNNTFPTIVPFKPYLAENTSLQRCNCNIFGLTATVALFGKEARFFRFRVFFPACYLQNEVGDPPFFLHF